MLAQYRDSPMSLHSFPLPVPGPGSPSMSSVIIGTSRLWFALAPFPDPRPPLEKKHHRFASPSVSSSANVYGYAVNLANAVPYVYYFGTE